MGMFDALDSYEEKDIFTEPISKPLTLEEAVSGIQDIKEDKGDDVPKSAYILCEKLNFRTEAFLNEFSLEYRAETISLDNPKLPKRINPICFIIDINSFMLSSTAQSEINHIQDISMDKTVPIFLIGDPKELIKAKELMAILNNRIVVEFERPIDVKRCIKKIRKKIEKINKGEGPKHILVVDDSITFLKLIRKTLEGTYKLTMSYSAFDCIQKMAVMPTPPDLIIIDYMMPDCNGLTLCRMLRGNEETKDIPIVFYSGNNDVDEIIQLMPIIDGYYLKSQPTSNLIPYLDEIFEKRKKK